MRKILIGILLGLSLGISFSLFAWVNPSQNPPSGGGVLQTSNTGLTINTSTYFISGNVGIGTTAPAYKLDVRGDIGTALSGVIKDSIIQPGAYQIGNDFILFHQQNWLAYAHRRYTISSVPSKTWDNAFIDGDTYVAISNTEVPITLTIDGITDFPYYSATYYHRPFVLFHSGYFQYIKVEIKDNTDTWLTMQEVTNNTKGMWVGNRMRGFTAPIKGIRFTFGNPSRSTVYVKEIGIYHPNMEFTKYYVSRSGDTMYGTLNLTSGNLYVASGNVGIGTTTPSQKLHVAGGSAVFGYIAGSSGGVFIAAPAAYGQPAIQGVTSAFTPGTLIINPVGGNVGIGTTTPVQKLHIEGNTYISGNVGIGTTAPLDKLDVRGRRALIHVSGNTYNIDGWGKYVVVGEIARENIWPTFLPAGSIGLEAIWESDSLFVGLRDYGWDRKDAIINWGDNTNDNLRIQFNGDDRILITSAGNVGIGTTNPGGYRLYVNGSLYASSYYCASDIRLKNDIQELNDTLEKIMNLHPISFVWNEKSEKAGKKDIGISGQEIEKYFPELVFKNDDGYISVDYSKLSVVAISAIKEQQKIIEEQAQKIKILEEKIKELESKIEKR